MTRFFSYFNLIVASFAIVIGGIIPFYDLIQGGKISCSSALGFGILSGGIILITATFFINKSDLKAKTIYFLCALIVTYVVQGVIGNIIPSFYGLSGVSENCSLFLG